MGTVENVQRSVKDNAAKAPYRCNPGRLSVASFHLIEGRVLIIESDMIVQGQLTIVGTVRLEGRFDGALVCTRLEIGTDGYLMGQVVTGELVVAGQIVGQIRARLADLKPTAIVEGQLWHEQLRMDAAATLVGESRRQSYLDMPPEFLALEARVRQTEDDFRRLETESRVRWAEEAKSAQAQFAALRARFPAPLPAAGRQ